MVSKTQYKKVKYPLPADTIRTRGVRSISCLHKICHAMYIALFKSCNICMYIYCRYMSVFALLTIHIPIIMNTCL